MKVELEPFPVLIPSPAFLVSVGAGDDARILTVAWVTSISPNPPTVSVGIHRSRKSFSMLKDMGDFVLNVPSSDMVSSLWESGMMSGAKTIKFEESNLTPSPSKRIKSSQILECPVNIECKIRYTMETDSHDLYVSEIVLIHADESVLDENGELEIYSPKLFTHKTIGSEFIAIANELDGESSLNDADAFSFSNGFLFGRRID